MTRLTQTWLEKQHQARVLHVFDRACNLISSTSDVIALVLPSIGNGPFSVVIPSTGHTQQIEPDMPVHCYPDRLEIGNLVISSTDARIWNSSPPWEKLHHVAPDISKNIAQFLSIIGTSSPSESLSEYDRSPPPSESSVDRQILRAAESGLETLVNGIASKDLALCIDGSSQLAGLGKGLTPDGDDILVGCLLATWIRLPTHEAKLVTSHITETAVDRTTPLSRAWLRAAARGECSEPWHLLFKGLLQGSKAAIDSAARRVMQQGHSSGASALGGFCAVLSADMSY